MHRTVMLENSPISSKDTSIHARVLGGNLRTVFRLIDGGVDVDTKHMKAKDYKDGASSYDKKNARLKVQAALQKAVVSSSAASVMADNGL